MRQSCGMGIGARALTVALVFTVNKCSLDGIRHFFPIADDCKSRVFQTNSLTDDSRLRRLFTAKHQKQSLISSERTFVPRRSNRLKRCVRFRAVGGETGVPRDEPPARA